MVYLVSNYCFSSDLMVYINPVRDDSCISIVHLYVCSLQEKIDLICADLNNYDLICITEVWLNQGITDTDILLAIITLYVKIS